MISDRLPSTMVVEDGQSRNTSDCRVSGGHAIVAITTERPRAGNGRSVARSERRRRADGREPDDR